MERMYDTGAWLLSSFGIALLVISLVVVPTNISLGQYGVVCDDAGCAKCDITFGCGPVAGCPCKPAYPTCNCDVGNTKCYCYPG